VATLASISKPSIGSVNRIDASGFSPSSTTAMFVYSLGQIPGGVPFFGGHLLITLPQAGLFQVPLASGAAQVSVRIPLDPALIGASTYWQAAAIDLAQPSRLAFSNGLAMTVCGLLD